jgi:hypothetical protein
MVTAPVAADCHPVRGDMDACELADPADVHQVVERRQPQRQHRDEALPAGEDLRPFAELGEERHRFLRTRRRVVVEGRRLHSPPR